MQVETKDITVLKENLEVVMKQLLDLLREILSSIHEERIVIGRNEIRKIKEVLESRQELMDVFNMRYKEFISFLHHMTEELATDFSLSEGLEWLQIHLKAEDVELLLLSEQLVSMGKEMQAETKTLISFLEHKSAFERPLDSYLIKLSPKPSRVAIGLADDDEDDQGFRT
ncbi:MAG TPA: hypothetical protein VGP47_00640 [Parachlamydiaceae bacterium]|nr:hypothetical protein [Parachlamydiaceae bacterium]